jgi:hypothetical protein
MKKHPEMKASRCLSGGQNRIQQALKVSHQTAQPDPGRSARRVARAVVGWVGLPRCRRPPVRPVRQRRKPLHGHRALLRGGGASTATPARPGPRRTFPATP